MTKEQKLDWLATATNEELLKQYTTFVREEALNSYRYGSFDPRTHESAEDAFLTQNELAKRLGI